MNKIIGFEAVEKVLSGIAKRIKVYIDSQ